MKEIKVTYGGFETKQQVDDAIYKRNKAKRE